MVAKAAMAGAYLDLICSIKDISERTQTFQGGNVVENAYTGYNLEAHFKYLLICRLRELMQEVMEAARGQDLTRQETSQRGDAYAAAVVLYHEIGHFRRSVRNGFLQNHVCPCSISLSSTLLTIIDAACPENASSGLAQLSWSRTPAKDTARLL